MINTSINSERILQNTICNPAIKIGYFPLRGRAQVPRLLLEYLKIPYEDVLFQSVK